MRDVLPLARLAHAVAFDGLGEDDGGAVLGAHRLGVGRIDLRGIVAAAGQGPDLIIGPVGHHGRELGILAEEMLAHIGAVLGLEVLVLAVDRLLHAPQEDAARVLGDQPVPARAPQHLDDVPAGTAEDALQLLDDLAVAAHRAVQALQVAVDDEDQVVELLAPAQRDGAQALGLVRLPVAEERPHLAVGGIRQPAMVQIFEKAGLIDRHQRSQAHRDGRELPVVRHQPGMGIGAQALALHLLAEVQELLLAEPALEEAPRIDAGRAVALDVDEIAAMALVRGMPEMHEARLVERRRRLVARDVAAQLGGELVGPQHDRERVPADVAADMALDRPVARMRRLLIGRDGVEIGRVGRVGDRRTLAARLEHQLGQEIVRALAALEGQDRIQRVAPLARLYGVQVVEPVHRFASAHLSLPPTIRRRHGRRAPARAPGPASARSFAPRRRSVEPGIGRPPAPGPVLAR